MHPILLIYHGRPIFTYTVIYAIAIVASITIAVVKAKKLGLDPWEVLAAALLITAVAKIGAQLYSVLLMLIRHPVFNLKHPQRLWNVFKTGGAFHGALLFGLAFAIIYLRHTFKDKWVLVLDIGFWAVALTQGIGRLGCFSAGCCFGRPTNMPWGMVFPHLGPFRHPMAGVKIHPTQLYESFLDFLNFFYLTKLWKRRRFDGEITAHYLINYGLIRFFVEFYRGDAGRGGYIFKTSSPYLSMSLPQFFSILMIISGWLILHWGKKKLREEK